MPPVAAILALLLAAGDAPPRPAAGASNAARARAGLLPRKAARPPLPRRRLVTVSAPAPTFLPAPGPSAPPLPVVRATFSPSYRGVGSAPQELGGLRASLRGVRTEVTMRLVYDR